VTHLPFFLASFVWNYGLGMAAIAVSGVIAALRHWAFAPARAAQ
jgi:hypothetical protein